MDLRFLKELKLFRFYPDKADALRMPSDPEARYVCRPEKILAFDDVSTRYSKPPKATYKSQLHR